MKDSENKFLEAIEAFHEVIYQGTEIFLGNPFDLIEIDMSNIPSNCYFISDANIEKGVMYKIEDDSLKRCLYEFIENNEYRAFKGNKW